MEAQTDPQLNANMVGPGDNRRYKAQVIVGSIGIRDGRIGDDRRRAEDHGEGESGHDGFSDNWERNSVITVPGGGIEAARSDGMVRR